MRCQPLSKLLAATALCALLAPAGVHAWEGPLSCPTTSDSDASSQLLGDLEPVERKIELLDEETEVAATVSVRGGQQLVSVRTGKWQPHEGEDLLEAITPHVPATIRNASQVRFYARSRELDRCAGHDDEPDAFCGAMWLHPQRRPDGDAIVFSSEFFPPPDVPVRNITERTRFTAIAEAHFQFHLANEECAYDLDYPHSDDPNPDPSRKPKPIPELKKMSRVRILTHEFLHSVIFDQQAQARKGTGTDPVRAFEGLDRGRIRAHSSWERLVYLGIVDPDTVADIMEAIRDQGNDWVEAASSNEDAHDAPPREQVERVQRHIGLSPDARLVPVRTPEMAVLALDLGILDTKRRLVRLASEYQKSYRPETWKQWHTVRRERCKLHDLKARLLDQLGYASRFPGDTHSYTSADERLVIAATMALYDPDLFASEYNPEERRWIDEWMESSFGAPLAQLRDRLTFPETGAPPIVAKKP